MRALVVVDIDPDAVNPDSQGMFVRYNTESDEWDSLDAVVERLRDRQPQSTDEMLLHQAKVMTRELADGRRVWKRDRRLLAAYERPDLWEEWRRIAVPTLIVRGRQSNLADARDRRANARGNCWHTAPMLYALPNWKAEATGSTRSSPAHSKRQYAGL